MKNYFYINGERIPMSQETADNIVKVNKSNITTKFPTRSNSGIEINNFWAGCLYNKSIKNGSILFLNSTTHGTWYDKNDNIITGYLHYIPKKEICVK